MTEIDDAKLLLEEIQAALRRGTKHYTMDGARLLTVREIVETLVRDGQVRFEPVALGE